MWFQGAMMSIAFKEGLKIPPQAMEQVIVGANQDLRQVSWQHAQPISSVVVSWLIVTLKFDEYNFDYEYDFLVRLNSWQEFENCCRVKSCGHSPVFYEICWVSWSTLQVQKIRSRRTRCQTRTRYHVKRSWERKGPGNELFRECTLGVDYISLALLFQTQYKIRWPKSLERDWWFSETFGLRLFQTRS